MQLNCVLHKARCLEQRFHTTHLYSIILIYVFRVNLRLYKNYAMIWLFYAIRDNKTFLALFKKRKTNPCAGFLCKPRKLNRQVPSFSAYLDRKMLP